MNTTKEDLIKLTEAFLLLWEGTDGESDEVNALTDFWQAFCKRNELSSISADDLLHLLKPNGQQQSPPLPGQLSDDRRVDMLTGAMEGGSNYWYFLGEDAESVLEKYIFDLANVRKQRPFVDLIWEAIRAGASIPIRDAEDQETVLGHISMESIEEGERLMYEQQASHFGDILSECDDANTADVWLQYVVLKDLVYG